MAGIIEKTMSSFKNLNLRSVVMIVLVLIFIILLSYYFYYFIKPKVAPTYKHNLEGATNMNNKQAELMLFYVDWCPHCKTAKPEWEKVKAEFDGKTIDGYSVIFSEMNCTEETPEIEKMMNTYKIDGYPTIKLLKDNNVIDFDAKPTASNLTQFLQTML